MSSLISPALAPARRLALLFERLTQFSRPLSSLDVKNRVRFALNICNLVDDTGRASADAHVQHFVHHCLVRDTAVDCTHLANELRHLLHSRARNGGNRSSELGSGGDDSVAAASENALLASPNFLRSARAAEVLCKCAAEVVARDVQIAMTIGAARIEKAAAATDAATVAVRDRLRDMHDDVNVEDDDGAAAATFLRDAALQQRRARMNEVRRCWITLVALLSLALRWAASRTPHPASLSALMRIQRWDAAAAAAVNESSGHRADRSAVARHQQYVERQLVLQAVNDARWRQMHTVAFVVTSAMSMLDSAARAAASSLHDRSSEASRIVQREWGPRGRQRDAALSSLRSLKLTLSSSADLRRFVVHALNQCDAVLAELRIVAVSSLHADVGKQQQLSARSQLVAQLPGVLRVLTAVQGAVDADKRRSAIVKNRKAAAPDSGSSSSGVDAAESKRMLERIPAAIDACVQNALVELQGAFAPSVAENGSGSGELFPRPQVIQIVASLGFLHVVSFDTLRAIAGPLQVFELDRRGTPVQHQAALVSFVLNSLQQQKRTLLESNANKQVSERDAAAALCASLERQADPLVRRRVGAIVRVLRDEGRSAGFRRAARRFELAVTLLKLVARCPDVALPAAAALLCDELLPVMMAAIFAPPPTSHQQQQGPSAVQRRAAVWLDLRDIVLAMATLRNQHKRGLFRGDDAVAVGAALSRAEAQFAAHWAALGAAARAPRRTNETDPLRALLFEHDPADFRLAQHVVPIIAAWAVHSRAASGSDPTTIFKAVLRDLIAVVLERIARLQEPGVEAEATASVDDDDDYDGNGIAATENGGGNEPRPVDRSLKHIVWLRVLKESVKAVSAQLDGASVVPPEAVDDALAPLRAWSRHLVMQTALFARLPATKDHDGVSLPDWYGAFFDKSRPVLVPLSDSTRRAGVARFVMPSSAASSKAPASSPTRRDDSAAAPEPPVVVFDQAQVDEALAGF